ncbi:MAG: hypothetical protein SGARI_001904 [Bacillariaceae sp.]
MFLVVFQVEFPSMSGGDISPKLASKKLMHQDPPKSELGDFFSTLPVTKQQQILNYREGEALMVNIHFTHQGGTTMCGILGHSAQPNGPKGTPKFACMGDKDNVTKGAYPKGNPWPYDETATNIEKLLGHILNTPKN